MSILASSFYTPIRGSRLIKQITFSLIFSSSLVCMSCIHSLTGKESEMHYEAAQRFDRAGNYAAAREQYGQALMRAKYAKADQTTISMLTYNYARTAGYTCHLEDAERYFKESLEMERRISGPESGLSTMRTLEFARFYDDQSNFAQSAKFFSQGLPAVEKLGVERFDPVGFADALDEYGDVLTHLGKAQESKASHLKADALRNAHPGKAARVSIVRYTCQK